MDWFYARDGRQQGPVGDARFEELIRAGTVQPDTLVWREGMPDWRPLRVVRGDPGSPAIPGAAHAPCAECRGVFPQGEMVFLNRSWICARCKPVFLQRLAEGAAPAAGAAGFFWRTHKQLVLRKNTPLPDVCVRCNAPANGYRLKRQLYWHSPLYYLILLGMFLFCGTVLIYLIVAMIVRKKATVHIGLCEAHRNERKWCMIGAWLGVAAGAVITGLGFGGAEFNAARGLLIATGIVLFIAAIVVTIWKVPVVAAKKIDHDFVWLNGVGEPFLATLPDWPGPY